MAQQKLVVYVFVNKMIVSNDHFRCPKIQVPLLYFHHNKLFIVTEISISMIINNS